MPFPSTRVIPHGWAAHHRPTAEAGMPSTVDLHRPTGAGGWSPTTGPTPTSEAPYATGVPARLQRLPARDDGGEAAGQDVITSTYLVAVPMSAAPAHLRDGITVTANPDDPVLVGRTLRVTDITYGSTPWQRDLVAVLDLTDTTGG